MIGQWSGEGSKRCRWAFNGRFCVVGRELHGSDERECWEPCPFEKGRVESRAIGLANECGSGIGCESEIVGPWRRLVVEFEMWDVVDEDREAVDGVGVFAGARVVDVGCEAVGGGVGHDTMVNSSPSAASPTSPVTCSSILAAFALSFPSPGSLVSLVQTGVELHEQRTAIACFGSTESSSKPFW